ncbi:tetratricopeptide repeat protein [Magnetospirillum sp. SS-4]|uniref:tetratricopeptide repeat-containing glycosyltransferase family protein n=1 Tax=Magnetospirillum sp. SS-4 TaxID=2681465 RepID=UPI001382CCFA|nr:tetratricopeptide repeat-containing glycosyltransferase family protein [Magnetospirillum sp. SS-4]CAA7623183.1 putative TPR repeat-containing protein [Magnetospirillum sp. SS-4]
MDIDEELRLGIECQRAGRLGDAVRHYRQVLAHDPANLDALNLMSVLALTAGDGATAAALAASAVERQPDWFMSYLNLGNALQSLDRVGEAIDSFQKAITLHPGSAEAHINLSGALELAGRHAEAADMAVKAIMIAPHMADAHVNFGNALLGLDSPGEAVEAYVKATLLEPDNALAWFNMGNAFAAMGDHADAAERYRRAIAIADGAVKQFSLGNALRALLRLDEAEAAYLRALHHDPRYLDAFINLAAVQRERGRLAEAEATLRAALEIAPDEADLHWNLALVKLTGGDFAEGWREYEWRWRTPHFKPFVRRFASAPWRGESLAGRSILVHSEQGFGDALQMCRLVPMLADLGGEVTLECRTGLGRLFSTLDSRIAVVEGQAAPPPACDLHVALMSLPLRLGLTLDTIPARVPYLGVPAGAGDFADVAAAPGIRVGLAWSGSNTRRDNGGRSFAPHDLTGLPGARLFSLQKGDAAATASDLFDFGRMTDLGPRLADFADTAAAIMAMDLVISADTAVAHLAGALGKPVWVPLPDPCGAFLWMLGRDDSPWYPSLRLFRQPAPGDWAGALAGLRQAFADRFVQS